MKIFKLLNLSDQPFTPTEDDETPKASRTDVQNEYLAFYRACRYSYYDLTNHETDQSTSTLFQ